MRCSTKQKAPSCHHRNDWKQFEKIFRGYIYSSLIQRKKIYYFYSCKILLEDSFFRLFSARKEWTTENFAGHTDVGVVIIRYDGQETNRNHLINLLINNFEVNYITNALKICRKILLIKLLTIIRIINKNYQQENVKNSWKLRRLCRETQNRGISREKLLTEIEDGCSCSLYLGSKIPLYNPFNTLCFFKNGGYSPIPLRRKKRI